MKKSEKIERVTKTSTHPLQKIADALNELSHGESVRISASDLPQEYAAHRADLLEKELEDLTSLVLRVVRGDNARTPESYIVTSLGKGVPSDYS